MTLFIRRLPICGWCGFRICSPTKRCFGYLKAEGNLAGNFRADFRPIFGQTLPQNHSRSAGLVLQCPLHHKSAPQANILRAWTRASKIALSSPSVEKAVMS